jgi:catechol 2,3-dioxygenase-like lactoylglutathione lyase family enzyme
MRCALSFVELRVRDWPASLAWYRDVLGLGVLLQVDADAFALLDAGPARLALKGEPGTSVAGGVLLAFEVEHLDDWLERLAGSGVETDGPVKASAEGYRRALLRDPDGHLLSLFEWASAPSPAEQRLP